MHVVGIKGKLRVKALEKHRLLLYFQRVADFEVEEDRKAKAYPPPLNLAEYYLSLSGAWRVRELAGIVHSPTLRADGSILSKPGYDEASGLILDTQGVRFPDIPDAPTEKEARDAPRALRDVLREFPFVDDADRSVALSAVLTGAVRRSLGAAPGHWFDAPQSGTGKTYLCDTITTIAFGEPTAPSPLPSNEKELKKWLLGKLLSGAPAIVIDNIDDPLESAALCVALQSLTYSDRQPLRRLEASRRPAHQPREQVRVRGRGRPCTRRKTGQPDLKVWEPNERVW